MTQEQALNILVQATIKGQSKGAYELQEASIILEAIKVFQPVQNQEQEVVKED